MQERELFKLATTRDVTAAALRQRGISGSGATLAAHSATSVCHVGFERWISSTEPVGLAERITEEAATLRALTSLPPASDDTHGAATQVTS